MESNLDEKEFILTTSLQGDTAQTQKNKQNEKKENLTKYHF